MKRRRVTVTCFVLSSFASDAAYASAMRATRRCLPTSCCAVLIPRHAMRERRQKRRFVHEARRSNPPRQASLYAMPLWFFTQDAAAASRRRRFATPR